MLEPSGPNFAPHPKQFAFDVRLDVFKGSLCGSSASAKDHHVVGVPREAVAAAFELMVELIEQDICQYRAHGAALGSADLARRFFSVFRYGRSKKFVDERNHSSVFDPVG